MAPISNSHQVLFLNSYHLLYLSYTAFLSSIVSRGQGGSLRPPLPSIVRQSLSRRRLAYLGTVDITTSSSTTGGDGATESGGGGGVPYPHLSLMRFTYLPEEDAILMSTNVYTKKYDMLSAGAAGGVSGRGGGGGGALVALLVHDFADSSHSSSTGDVKEVNGESSGGMYSITLNGTCSVVKDGKHVLAKSTIILAAYWHCIGSLTSFFLPFLSLSHIIIYNIIILVILAEKYRQIHLKNNPDYPQASTTS